MIRVQPRATALMTPLLVVSVLASSAFAQSGGRALDQLFHQMWGIREGAPGAVLSILQTRDGYLVLGGADGVYRFDGVRFTRLIDAAADIRSVNQLAEAPDGSLWIAHANRVSHVVRGTVTTFGTDDGVPASSILSLAIEQDGTVWVAASAGFARFQQQAWSPVSPIPDRPSLGGSAVFVSRDGTVWLGTSEGLFARDTTAPGFRSTGVAGSIRLMTTARDGSLWVATHDGVVQRVFDAGRRPVDGPRVRAAGRAMILDRHDAVWMATYDGVVRAVPDGSPPDVLADATLEDAFAVFEDRESNVWVGTNRGLHLFRATALVPAELPARVHAGRLAAASDGSVWIASQNHPLLRWRGGSSTATPVAPPVTAVHVDREGTVWAWASGGLWRTRGEGFERVGPVRDRDASILATDDRSVLWAWFPDGRCFTYANGAWAPARVEGLTATSGRPRLASMDARGRLWVGYDSGALAIVEGGRAAVAFETSAVGSITAIAHQGARHWVAGTRSVIRIEGEQFTPLATLARVTGRVKGLVAPVDGGLWLNADRGIVHVAPDEIERLLDDPAATPRVRVFDYLDGSIGGAAPVPPQAALAGRDGRLWFVGFDSVVWLDPDRATSNPLPPPVHIESLRADGREYGVEEAVRLPVGTRQVQLTFTALSLAMPTRVRFRYRLDGFDDEWRDSEGRREAFYTNVPPGTYRFRVIAANNDGIWNEEGAAVAFAVPPALHQTMAFKAAGVVAILAAAWLAHRGRLRYAEAQLRSRLEARVSERERIARELHDTLLQGLQGLILKFQAAADAVPPDMRAAAMLEGTLARADQVLIESRDRVRDLRLSADARADLPEALSQMGGELAGSAAPLFHVKVVGDPRPLHPIVSDEAFWIVREAVLNAFRHAAARRVDVTVEYGARELRLSCRDDGQGLSPSPSTDGAARLGMRGMRERARRIGAHLGVRSHEGQGTEIEVRVAAATAYRATPGHEAFWRRWLRAVAPQEPVS